MRTMCWTESSPGGAMRRNLVLNTGWLGVFGVSLLGGDNAETFRPCPFVTDSEKMLGCLLLQLPHILDMSVLPETSTRRLTWKKKPSFPGTPGNLSPLTSAATNISSWGTQPPVATLVTWHWGLFLLHKQSRLHLDSRAGCRNL